jgi:pimeloyl-ACP methyl ester carboxylesterase
LAVTFSMPAAAVRPPAVLILPGSGPATRQDARAFTEAFLRSGLAVLSFDKRGCGASTGAWTSSSLEDMAADGRVLLDWLRARPEIDPGRVGLSGHSQGGWVAPLVASGRTDVAFLIALTGGAVSPRTIETFDAERRLQRSGVEGAALAKARGALAAYFRYLAGEQPRAAIEAQLDAGRGEAWATALGLERVLPGESSRAAWAWVATFDPLPSLRTLRLPVLAVIGGRDRDPAVEVAAWLAGLAENGDPRTEVRVVPADGHVLSTGASHTHGSIDAEALDRVAAWAASIRPR